MTAALIEDLKARNLLNQATADDDLIDHLGSGCRTLYCGFDPTADSLHIGSLVPLLTLKRFQQAGHRPIALVGGATGLIGDPSFKAQERQLNSADVVSSWVEKIKAQVSQFISFDLDQDNAALVVNNLDWTNNLSTIDFLREVGKHFSVNNMIQKESVKQRIEREGSGISFTEFTYMLLQSFDFAELAQRNECTLQIGGSDQWGNIVGGVDLARRMYGKSVYGLTLPLVTKSDGTKFGKTESGTIWLDPSKTSPYAFYQFWLNTADDDVYKFLKYFTFLSVAEIDAIEAHDASIDGRKTAQFKLADEVTRLVHGDDALVSAKRITDALFNGDVLQLSEQELEQIQLDGLPSSQLNVSALQDTPLTSLFAEQGVVKAGREVKDALGRKAVFINGQPKGMEDNMNAPQCFAKDDALYGRFFIVKIGKKKHHLFEITSA